MRDPEILLALLRSMAENDAGQYLIVPTLDTSQKELHHLQLLVDAGHVEWHPPKLPRITNDGYDFIEAVDNNEGAMNAFLEKLRVGVPYVNAALAAVKMLSE